MTYHDLIIALDFKNRAETMEFLSKFKGLDPFVKVGMELFYSEGPDIVRELKAMGARVFLDLKLHDIPNTVGSAMARLAGIGADMVNVHAAGGSEMMKRAVAAFDNAEKRPAIIAVTQLTSTGPEMLRDELLIGTPMDETVIHYAKNAMASGLDGVVCSPKEAGAVKLACGKSFLTVTPGIRRASDALGDQKRVTTPRDAREFSDCIVVGRPITRSEDPVQSWKEMRADFMGE